MNIGTKFTMQQKREKSQSCKVTAGMGETHVLHLSDFVATALPERPTEVDCFVVVIIIQAYKI